MFFNCGGISSVIRALDCRARGCPWVLSFEWKRSATENLLDPALQATLLRLISMMVFKLVGSAMICSSFTRAITPPVRSVRYPRGFPSLRGNMRDKVRDGNRHFDFNKQVVSTADESGVFFWLENPDSSFVWGQKGFEKFRSPASRRVFRTDFCRYGTLWRKSTRLALSLPSLAGVRILCRCKRKHLVLRGTCRARRMPWTAVAEPYPSRFSALVATAAAHDCGWKPMSQTVKRKLNLGACAQKLETVGLEKQIILGLEKQSQLETFLWKTSLCKPSLPFELEMLNWKIF